MPRALVPSLLLVATTTVAIGALTTSWWSYAGDEMSVSTGLRTSEFCFPDRCASTWLGQGSHDERWVRTGVATFAASLLAASLSFFLALSVRLRRTPDLLIKTSLVASVSTLLSGVLFVWLAPQMYPDKSVGYSMICFFAGISLAIVGAMLARRDAARVAPDQPG